MNGSKCFFNFSAFLPECNIDVLLFPSICSLPCFVRINCVYNMFYPALQWCGVSIYLVCSEFSCKPSALLASYRAVPLFIVVRFLSNELMPLVYTWRSSNVLCRHSNSDHCICAGGPQSDQKCWCLLYKGILFPGTYAGVAGIWWMLEVQQQEWFMEKNWPLHESGEGTYTQGQWDRPCCECLLWRYFWCGFV